MRILIDGKLKLGASVISGGTLDDCVIGGITPAAGTFTTVTTTTPNTNALILGGSSAEGGDIAVYRDASNNTQLTLDADAASNAKALDVYGGAVFQNHLTVGQTTLQPAYKIFATGLSHLSSIETSILTLTSSNGITTYNNLQIPINALVGTSSSNHAISLKIDSNDIFCAQATGDGAGGVVDLKAIVKEQLVYTPSSDTAITAAGGITVTKAIMRIAGDSGAIDITANPQIAAGTDGQVVIIQGTSDANTVTLDDGDGLALSAQCVLAAQDNITLMYDVNTTEWIETSRCSVV